MVELSENKKFAVADGIVTTKSLAVRLPKLFKLIWLELVPEPLLPLLPLLLFVKLGAKLTVVLAGG